MGTKQKAKTKIKAKIAKANRKIARKCGGMVIVATILGASLAISGCATSDAAQPAKANTMENKFEKCVIVIASKARIPTAGTNTVIEADGGNLPTVEMFTQTQSLENSGSETTTQKTEQTPTTDVKPDIDVTVPVTKGVGGEAGDAAASLISGAIKGLNNKSSASCTTGNCNDSSATCKDGSCSGFTACSGDSCKDN